MASATERQPAPIIGRGSPVSSNKRPQTLNLILDRAWRWGWATRPSLNPDLLVHKAARQAGSGADEDCSGWRSRLACLCSDLEEHADLNPLGRTLAHGQLVSALAARFRAHALWRLHPEIGTRPISSPIIIVGQMRSGSTRMQRLLACDPRLTFTRFYESWNPIASGNPPIRFDERKMKARMSLAFACWVNPTFKSFHPTAWNAPDEEIGLHNLSIFGTAYEAQWHVPNYTAAVENTDGVTVYREFKHLLQTLSWQRRDSPDRPWVLKVPQFSQDLPALLRVFPDARVIYLQRDPSQVAASCASLVCNQMSIQSGSVDPQRVRREWSRKVLLRAGRIAAAQAAGATRQIEVRYEDVSQDWKGEMRRVYEMLQLPLEEEAVRAMAAYIHASRRH